MTIGELHQTDRKTDDDNKFDYTFFILSNYLQDKNKMFGPERKNITTKLLSE